VAVCFILNKKELGNGCVTLATHGPTLGPSLCFDGFIEDKDLKDVGFLCLFLICGSSTIEQWLTFMENLHQTFCYSSKLPKNL